MSESIIFENVSKRFRLLGWNYTLRDELAALVKRLVGRHNPRILHALKDVSFSINEGDSVGIIGPNGAGKTTILRLVSRITLPSNGKIFVKGQVTSLIEVFAGLHPELSGRENIYLYGAILGMSRKQIKSKFDEIAEYSGLDNFLEVPIKQYSLGMTMRLGFSTIIHSNPEILLIDEVIVVGDMVFMEKAFKTLADLKKKGVTLILVTHIIDIMRNMVSKIIYLKDGCMRYMGDPDTAINMYISERKSMAVSNYVDLSEGKTTFKLKSLNLVDRNGKETLEFESASPAKLCIEYESQKDFYPVFEIKLLTIEGQTITSFNNKCENVSLPSSGRALIEFPSLALLPNQYKLEVSVYDSNCLIKYGYSSLPLRITGTTNASGIVLLTHTWKQE